MTMEFRAVKTGSHPAVGHRVAARLSIGVLAATATVWLWTSLVAIANFAFRYPSFDQFRLYAIYLGLPFPRNLLQLENGHRPVLPALVRVAEIHWFGADQMLQTVVGCAAVLLALSLIVATVLRERDVPAVNRASACLLAVIALFWLGNARILMHGNELVHAYFVVLFTVLALLAVMAARRAHPARWMLVSALCCLAATFSFGTGMASFGAVLLLGVIGRVRWRYLAIVAGFLGVALTVYVLGMPGSAGVRGSLLFDPAGNFAVVARWLAAPWMRAWLGHGDPSMEPWLQSSLLHTTLGAPLVASAQGLSRAFGEGATMWIGALLGIAGLAAFLLACLGASRNSVRLTRAQELGLGLAAFAVSAAVIVCFARLNAFTVSPSQVFADRYLPWSCLFWLGLALYAGCGSGPRRSWRTAGFAATALAVALVLAPSHRALAGWSATVSRHIQQSAVAAQLGIWDPARFEDPSATNEDVEASLGLFRRQHLAMYAEPAFRLVEHGWSAPLPLPAPLDGAHARVVREFVDPHSHRRVADFEGWVSRIEGIPRDPVLAVVDARNTLRGLAKLSYIGPNKKSLRLNLAKKRGFDGYVLDPRPGEQLSILVLDASNTRTLALVPLQIPENTPGTE